MILKTELFEFLLSMHPLLCIFKFIFNKNHMSKQRLLNLPTVPVSDVYIQISPIEPLPSLLVSANSLAILCTGLSIRSC